MVTLSGFPTALDQETKVDTSPASEAILRPFDPNDTVAYLAPEIVKAAVEGRLPRGFGLKRLVDLPMAWPDQWSTLGLQAPAQA
jgi:hypothetical protein